MVGILPLSTQTQRPWSRLSKQVESGFDSFRVPRKEVTEVAPGFGMLHNDKTMTNLIIEMPDELARSLAEIAAARHKSVQELAVERLHSLVEESSTERPAGSADAVLRVMFEPPHLSASDVDDLDAAIAAARIPIQAPDLFTD